MRYGISFRRKKATSVTARLTHPPQKKVFDAKLVGDGSGKLELRDKAQADAVLEALKAPPIPSPT